MCFLIMSFTWCALIKHVGSHQPIVFICSFELVHNPLHFADYTLILQITPYNFAVYTNYSVTWFDAFCLFFLCILCVYPRF